MSMVLWIDPPSGHLFGFPKPIPDDLKLEDETQWFLDNGYPQKLIDQGMLRHCRFWEEEE